MGNYDLAVCEDTFISENPILLTSDNGLQVKAKGLKISTITLSEFLKQFRRL